MKTKIKVPRWLLKREHESTREFKQRKRYEARLLQKQVELFRLGCAYTPACEILNKIAEQVKKLRVALKVKNWGN